MDQVIICQGLFSGEANNSGALEELEQESEHSTFNSLEEYVWLGS